MNVARKTKHNMKITMLVSGRVLSGEQNRKRARTEPRPPGITQEQARQRE
jgi:hypothetical protein